MSQHRFFSALLSLTTVAGCFGLSSASYAASEPASISSDRANLAIAQATAASEESVDRTLYVTGLSEINVPADQAILILSYYPNTYTTDYSEPSTNAQPQVLPTDLSAAVNAATGAGVPTGRATAYPDLSSPGSMRVRIVLDQPTQDQVQQIINDVNTVIIKTNRFVNGGASASYTTRDCGAIEKQARQAAMTDAQQRATALADVAGVGVGRIINLSESVTWGNSYSGTCPSSSSSIAYTDIYSMPTYDASVPPVVRLNYSLSVTYGIR